MLEFKFIPGEMGYELSKDLRKEIFSDELGMSEISDGFEKDSYHFVGYDKTLQISVARLYPIDEKNYKIAFVGIRDGYRRQYVGDLIMRALADKTVALGGTNIILEAPKELLGFFEFEDYKPYGDEFLVDGVPHIMMKKDLTKIQKCRGCNKS